MPSPQLQTIIQMLKSVPARDDVPIAEIRAGFEQLATFFPTAADVKCERVDVDGIPAEWVAAPGASGDHAVLWLHGGGYVLGSLNTHRDLAARVSRATGARTLLIDYRLAPEHIFPAAVEDATKAYRWLLAQGIDPQRIVIAGDSAGGGLTVATLVSLRDAGDPLPAAAVCVSPWTDLEGTGESMATKADVDPMVQKEPLLKMAKVYAGEADLRHPLVSPIYADLSGLPPMLIHVGTAETLLDDSTRLAQRAQAAGVEVTLEPWEEMIHVWHIFAAMLPEGQQAIDGIGRWVRGRIGSPAVSAGVAAV
ncbi:MAG: alpha/beta hydrolase [Dehalococcoidia bacterium]|nr:alpha/beta hydrolase [Dehalococcoidia bacterium]